VKILKLSSTNERNKITIDKHRAKIVLLESKIANIDTYTTSLVKDAHKTKETLDKHASQIKTLNIKSFNEKKVSESKSYASSRARSKSSTPLMNGEGIIVNSVNTKD
jgi:hypothetical protein